MSIRAAVRYLQQGDWEKAHAIRAGRRVRAWVRGYTRIVHLQEGDVDNARYWFGRARRHFSPDLHAELKALTLALGDS